MADDKGCRRCHDRASHPDAVTEAHCAYRTTTTDAVKDHARELGVSPIAAADLLAHLRSVATDHQAYAMALYVVDLGWRPALVAS